MILEELDTVLENLAKRTGKTKAEVLRLAINLMEKAIVEKELRCPFRFRHGILTPPDDNRPPDGTRCLLDRHDASIPHKWQP